MTILTKAPVMNLMNLSFNLQDQIVTTRTTSGEFRRGATLRPSASIALDILLVLLVLAEAKRVGLTF